MEIVTVRVYLATSENIMSIQISSSSTVEELSIKICKCLKISPVAQYLFALKIHGTQVFLTQSAIIESSHAYDFRIRYKIPSISRLRDLDMRTLNYYFHQARKDVLHSKIPEIIYPKHKNELVGLGIADMYRVMKEEGKSCDEVEKDYKKFFPRDLIKKHSFFTKKPIHNTLAKLQRSSYDTWYVKFEYLKQFGMMAPNYLSEDYGILYEVEGSVYNVTLHVMPFHKEQPGLRVFYEHKDEWIHICTIEELCFMSARNDGTLEISRKNGIPVYLKFMTSPHMYSFISCCDGYYRLMVKWTFNICKDVPTPSLQKLHSMKCHGPVGGVFSYHKLIEKRGYKPGCYILRQCEQYYDVYYIDVFTKNSTKPETYKIEKQDNNYIFNDDPKCQFSSIAQLIVFHNNSEKRIYLQECLPPSEYDKSPLLLCDEYLKGTAYRIEVGEDLETLLSQNKNPRLIRTDDLLLFKGTRVERKEGITVMYKAEWKVVQGKKMEVAMKLIKQDAYDQYLKEFIDLAGRWANLNSIAIVKLYGFTLRSPISMIMEYMKFGPLDMYLREKRAHIQVVDLVEASASLATALWHLAEAGVVHANIRCRKMLVANHTKERFEVKLSDPGLHSSYEAEDVHWLPIECFSIPEAAKKSTSADVWAFATTLWEIFSYGISPANINPVLTEKSYLSGHRLCIPSGCPPEMWSLIRNSWQADPHRRAQPHALMRDINHILYQVFNSRRTHSYATVFPKSFKDSSVITGSATSLLSNGTTESCLEALLSAGDAERCSMRSVSSGFSGGSAHTATTDQDNFQEEDTISCDISTMLSNLNFSTMNSTNSLDSVNSLQCIFELGSDCNLVLQGRIGQGFYGEVFKGTLERDGESEPSLVAVKKLKTTALSQMQDFEREITIMKTLKHRNIVEILGVIEEPEVQLIMEYVRHGSLQSYLKIHRHSVTVKHLLGYALDVALGMEYLGMKHVVHRDLAARNILVVAEDHVKISDFGLAQVMSKGDYYILKTNRDLPLKWYAPESVSDGKYSCRSDVWSYGVTLWEMFSYGEEPPPWGPNAHMTNNSVVNSDSRTHLLSTASSGNSSADGDKVSRLGCPAACPTEVYARLLLPCWNAVPHQRPTFTQLAAICRDIAPQY